MIKNPIYNTIEENLTKEDGKTATKRVIDTYGLYLSFIMVLSYLLFIFIYNDSWGNTISIVILSVSLLMSVISLVLIPSLLEKPTAFIIMYEIFTGIFISVCSIFLKNHLLMVNETFNPNSSVFITIGATIVGSIFLSHIFYFLDIFKVRHFYYKYALLSAIEIIIFLSIVYFVSLNIDIYSFTFNALVGVVTILLFNLIIVLYNEELRKLVEKGINKKEAFILAILPSTIVNYLFAEIVFLLSKKH